MTDPATIRARALDLLESSKEGCPACGGDSLTGGNASIEDGRAYQSITCDDCGASWTEGYRRVNMHDVELDGDEERVLSIVSIDDRTLGLPDGAASPPPPFQLAAYYSETDQVPVVHVDTVGMPENAKGPICRIYLNDSGAPLFANPDMEDGR